MIKRYGLIIFVMVLMSVGYLSLPHKAAAAVCPPPNQDFTDTCESDDPPSGDPIGTPPLGDTTGGQAGLSSDGNNGYTSRLFVFVFPANAGQIYQVDMEMLRNDSPTPGVDFCVNNTSAFGDGLCYTAQNLDSGPNVNSFSQPILAIDSTDYTYYSHLVVRLTVHQTFFNENNVITKWTMHRREFSDLESKQLITPTINVGSSPQFAWNVTGTAVPVRKMFMEGPNGISGYWDDSSGVPQQTDNWSPPITLDTPGTYNFGFEASGPARYGGEEKRTWDTQVVVQASGSAPGPFTVADLSCFGWPNPEVEVNIRTSPGADTYDLERREGSGGWSVIVSGLSYAQFDSYSDDTVINGHTYEYRVKATNPTGSTYTTNTLYLDITAANCGGVGQNSLRIIKAGSGTGVVTSNPSGINCGPTCTANYTTGTAITLTAAATSGSTFVGWSGGGCSGTGNCNLVLNSNTTVTATFDDISGCVGLNALFVSQTINGTTYNSPATISLEPNTTYPVSITMQNPCGGVWNNGNGYGLGSQNPADNMTWGLNRVPITTDVFQFASYTFNFNITVPASGINNFQWRMVQNTVFGWFGDYTPNITIIADQPPSLWIDGPANGSTVSGLVSIEGWALDNVFVAEGIIKNFDVFLDGVLIDQSSYGNWSRPDVCGAFPGRAQCPLVGYRLGWDSTTGPNGPRVITIRVIDAANHPAAISHTVNVNNQPPVTPPTITGISNTTGGCGKLVVTWRDNSTTEDRFQVWRSTTSGSGYIQVTGDINSFANKPTTGTSYTITDPVPVSNMRYYYVVKALKDTAPVQVATSTESSGFAVVCVSDLTSSTKAISKVAGVNYTASTIIKDTNTVTFQITINNINSGAASATIDYICDTPSSNFINLRNLNVSGGGSAAFGGASCSGSNEINISGMTINASGSRTITFDSTFKSSGSSLELCSNRAVIHYTDAEGAKTQNIQIPTRLCSKPASGAPDFDEVAP